MNEPDSARDVARLREAPGSRLGRWVRLTAIGVAVPVLASLLMIAPSVLNNLNSRPAAKYIRAELFLWAFVAYSVGLVLIPVGLGLLVGLGLRWRKQGNSRLAARAGKASLLALGLLVAIALSEVVCAWKLQRLSRLFHLPTAARRAEPSLNGEPTPKVKDDARPLRNLAKKVVGNDPSAETIDIAIIGGSSAAGVPFEKLLSVDRIVAWQLGRAFPGRSFRAETLALPGLTLEQAIAQLSRLTRNPDLLIIYSGHNEFQTRFGLMRKVPHYFSDPMLTRIALAPSIRAVSNTAELLGRSIDRFHAEFVDLRPKALLPDSPCCTPAEVVDTLAEYRRRLDGLLDDCNAEGIATIVVLPPSNEGGFDPNRSILPPETTRAAQIDFLMRLDEAMRQESSDPVQAAETYRRLIAEQPGFAESHYRLGRLLEASGSYARAKDEYIQARELDGAPFRCQAPYLEACRELGERHGSIIVDAPRLLANASPHGIIDDRLISDAHHPGLNAFVIMAREAVLQLKQRKTFGWPDSTPAPSFTMADCIAHFRLDQEAWITACRGSAAFYRRTELLVRYPSLRDSVREQCERAITLLQSGAAPQETGIPSMRIDEELRADSPPPKTVVLDDLPGLEILSPFLSSSRAILQSPDFTKTYHGNSQNRLVSP